MRLDFDIETCSTVDLAEVGSYLYARHPTTDIRCISYRLVDDDDKPGPIATWLPGDPVPKLIIDIAADPNILICAFNINFDGQILEQILVPRYAFPAIPRERWRCAQAAALARALPGSLDAVAAALELTVRKTKEGTATMRQLARPRKQTKKEQRDGKPLDFSVTAKELQTLIEYNQIDVAMLTEVVAHAGLLPPAEQAVWHLDQVINERGVHIDVSLLETALAIVHEAEVEIHDQLATLTAGAVTKPKQRDRILKWAAEQNYPLLNLRKGTVTDILLEPDLPERVRQLLELRQSGAGAASSKLPTMRRWVSEPDHHIRHAYRYHGASSGRFTSLGVQLHNLKRCEFADVAGAITAVQSGSLRELYDRGFTPPLEVIGQLARALPTPAPGMRFFCGDLSGIEARSAAYTVGDRHELEQWQAFDRSGRLADEPYYITGITTFHQPPKSARPIGKFGQLAFQYQGGVGAYRRIAHDSTTSDEIIDQRKLAWRAAHPLYTQFWRTSIFQAVQAIRNPGMEFTLKGIIFRYNRYTGFLELTLPSGRTLSYPKAEIIIDEQYESTSFTFFDASGGGAGKMYHERKGSGAFGGLMLENITQGICRDIFVEAMLRLEAAGYRVVAHTHDDYVVEVPEDFGALAEFVHIITTPPGWAPGLPIAAKARIADRFVEIPEPTQTEIIVTDNALENRREELREEADELAQIETTTEIADKMQSEPPSSETPTFGATLHERLELEPTLHGYSRPETATQIRSFQPQVGFSEVTEVCSEVEKRTGELPMGSDSEHNLTGTENDANGDSRTELHVCEQCHLNPPNGNERPSAYNNVWLHPGCLEAFARARMAEEGIPWINPSEPPEPKTPEPPRQSSTGNGRDDADTAAELMALLQPNPALSPRSNGYDRGETTRSPVIEDYIYRAADKRMHMKVERTSAKTFPTYCWNGGAWEPHWPKEVVPYRLPELFATPASMLVVITEGEKDADTAARYGFVATTNPGGAEKWQPELAQYFHGKQRVVIMEDNDPPGVRHTALILQALKEIVPTIGVVRFPELGPHGDLTDYFERGGSKPYLLTRIEEALKAGATLNYTLIDLYDYPPEAQDWLWEGHLPVGALELVAGLPGVGKSLLQCNLIAIITTGRDWPDGAPGPQPGRVIILTAEDRVADLVRRLTAAGADQRLTTVFGDVKRNDRNELFLLAQDLDKLEHAIHSKGNVRLVTIDPITAYMGSGKGFDSHRVTDVRSQLYPLSKLAEKLNVAFSAVTHPPKNAAMRIALDSFIGSQAFIAAARVGHYCVAEQGEEDNHGRRRPTGRVLFTTPKFSHSRPMPTLAYRIEEVRIGWDPKRARDIMVPRIVWDPEPVDVTADEAIVANRERHGDGRKARSASVKEFLRDILIAAGVPVPRNIIHERGALKNYSADQLWRARKAIGAVSFKPRGKPNSPWFWTMPEHMPSDTEMEEEP
jgi:DNA polymerase